MSRVDEESSIHLRLKSDIDVPAVLLVRPPLLFSCYFHYHYWYFTKHCNVARLAALVVNLLSSAVTISVLLWLLLRQTIFTHMSGSLAIVTLLCHLMSLCDQIILSFFSCSIQACLCNFELVNSLTMT